jgi:hypothetical protein
MGDHRKPPVYFWFSIAAGVGLIASLLISFMWCLGVFDAPEVIALPFDSTAWQRADPIEKHRTIRSQMIVDLLRRKLLDGLTRPEVERLLGPPLTDMQKLGVDPSSRWHVAYYLGTERAGAYSLDDEFLVIRFDHKAHVAEYRTVVN